MTAQDIITAALRDIMIVRTGQTPAATELADGLAALNRMLANWNTERLVVYAMNKFTGTLTAGKQNYTIGAGGDFSTTRPISIHSATIVSAVGSFTFPVALVDEKEFNSVPGRSTRQAKVPKKLWYQPLYPLGVVWLFPVPNTAASLELYSWVQLAQFAALGDNFDLPPGYELAIEKNLAIYLAPMFERVPSQALLLEATQAKSAITGVNAPPVPGAAEEVQTTGQAQPTPPAVPQQ